MPDLGYWKGVVDALNFAAALDSAAFEEQAYQLLAEFAKEKHLPAWKGEFDDSPYDYWPVTGGIGLTATPDGQLVIGWISEITTEMPFFWLA